MMSVGTIVVSMLAPYRRDAILRANGCFFVSGIVPMGLAVSPLSYDHPRAMTSPVGATIIWSFLALGILIGVLFKPKAPALQRENL